MQLQKFIRSTFLALNLTSLLIFIRKQVEAALSIYYGSQEVFFLIDLIEL